jgi:hypothetical protein
VQINVDRAFGTYVGQRIGVSERDFLVEEGTYIGKERIEMVSYDLGILSFIAVYGYGSRFLRLLFFPIYCFFYYGPRFPELIFVLD